MDVMKLCAAPRVAPACDLLPKNGRPARSTAPLVPPLVWRLGWMRPLPRARMMSDYKVALVDDNPSDIYVVFHGPKDSALSPPACLPSAPPAADVINTPQPSRPVPRRKLARARGAARRLPVQISLDRLLQSPLPPERGRDVRETTATPPSYAMPLPYHCQTALLPHSSQVPP